jgi:hypothetical protein
MGLDLVVEGCAKPGHEDEWRRLLERSFADEELVLKPTATDHSHLAARQSSELNRRNI